MKLGKIINRIQNNNKNNNNLFINQNLINNNYKTLFHPQNQNHQIILIKKMKELIFDKNKL